jgi:glycosyltransferase involved in cell wall biosynthesis
MTRWHVAVLIPARDEEELLARCLESVVRAGLALPSSVTFEVIVAVDSSTDRTKEIAEQMLAGCGSVICTDTGIVGEARARAAELALRKHRLPPKRTWIANTDADSFVPESWLLEQLSLADRGIEAIAGTVDVDSFDEHDPLVPTRFRETYLIRPDGTHPHVHGTNLGVRADVYRKAGGWRAIATAEDHDFWNRIGEIGASRMSAGHIRVITSGRRNGRAPSGFAERLAAHNGSAA